MSIALRSRHWGRGNADDCCGDLAALAVQRGWLIYAHVQTGAAGAERLDVDGAELLQALWVLVSVCQRLHVCWGAGVR